MTVRNLRFLFEPASVAVVGASNRPRSVGWAVMRNLLAGGFEGPIMPVNPRRQAVAGVLAYPDVASLPVAPELAVVCTPPASVPGLVSTLGEKGTRAAIVLTAGLAQETLEDGRSVERAMLEAARPHLLRVIGPNCLGLISPRHGLNASFAHVDAAPGHIAIVQQSGALGTAILDWARSNQVGLSHFVSVGDGADVDFGDLLDHLGGDPHTHSILLYIESIGDARKFMSAARAAARNKPVVVVKGGRGGEGARAAASHTGALAGGDAIYDAAFRRAGMLRVMTMAEMFDAVSTLARVEGSGGDRLAILTNGGGPGVLATDALTADRGALARLSEATMAALEACLPATWSKGNPVDIIGDATGDRYRQALAALLDEPDVGAVLVLHAPTATADSTEAAEGVIAAIREAGRTGKAILACWMGGASMRAARGRLAEAGIASYDTPEGAVRAFLHTVEFRRSQSLLTETPPSVPEAFRPATDAARLVIEGALADGRDVLSEPESKAVLSAYGLPVVETRIARGADDAVRAADALGYPVAVKILADGISHKSDVGGVALDVPDAAGVRAAVEGIGERVHAFAPGTEVYGFTVQRMARRPGAHEPIVGVTVDPIFGPAVLFGEGGTAVELVDDQAVALPPLNLKLARELVQRTRVARRLAGYRGRPAANEREILLALLRVSQLATDLPEVVELDVNPLLADEQGVLALDARIRVARSAGTGPERLAIRPYPKELEEWLPLAEGRVLMRPIRPEDEPAHRAFLDAMDPEDIRFRFFGAVRHFPHTQLARFTQIDYDREMAFIATTADDAAPETVGVVRAIADPDNETAEFAIIVSSRHKGLGIGCALLEKIIRYARARGTHKLVGEVLRTNQPMLGLARRLGFRTVGPAVDEAVAVASRSRPGDADWNRAPESATTGQAAAEGDR